MSASLTKPLPASHDAERAILGAILLDNNCYFQAVELLREGARHFLSPSHADTYAAMVRVFERGQGIDPITLQEEMRNSGTLDTAGGSAFIGTLIDGLPFTSNIEDHCRLVIEAWKRREIAKIANRTMAAAMGGERLADEVVSIACNDLAQVANCTEARKPEHIGKLADERLDAYQAASLTERFITGIKCGFPQIDGALSGFQKQLHYVAARPRIGKTSFMCSLAVQAASQSENNSPVIVLFSIESSREQITDRILAVRAQVNNFRMRTGMLTKAEWRTIVEAKEWLEQTGIIVDDRTHLTVPILKAACAQIKRQCGRLDMVMIDYAQRMKAHEIRHGMSRTNELQQISNELQAAQKELDTVMIGFLQAGRDVEQRADKRVQLADLRESATWEQDGRVILSLYRERVYDENAPPEAEITILKNNEGPSGITEKCVFVEGISAFEPSHQRV